jgi:hypothetical protein
VCVVGRVDTVRGVGVTVDALVVGDAPEAWTALGFAVEGDSVALGEVRVRAAGTQAGKGLIGWSLRGVGESELDQLDGLPTTLVDDPAPAGATLDPGASPGSEHPRPSPSHPNGITGVDHVVTITPRLERTVAALEAAGLDLRRIREELTPAGAPRQAFFRLGATILEVVQEPADVAATNGPDRPAFFWGIALLAPDIEATVAALGPDRVSEIRAAVQPGRRIASLRRDAGLSLPVALISPRPPR